jgi:hypothetical protein
MIVDALRTTLHRALTSPRGDHFTAIRVSKDLARGVNAMLGEPLCSASELDRRRAAAARLQRLRGAPSSAPAAKEPSPVMVYFEKDRNHRLLEQTEQVLKGRDIKYTRLDVTGDANTKSFVMREAKCAEDELPVVFVAGRAIGGYRELVAADTSGELMKAVFRR